MLTDVATREARLRATAERALRWFDNRIMGTGLNGLHTDISIARDLWAVLEEYRDTEPDPARRAELMDRR